MFKLSSDILLTVPRRCFFCGSFLLFMFHVCLYHTVLSVHCSLVITCWESADLLALLSVIFLVFLTFSHMVSRVGCGALLYRFLVFAFFFTFKCILLAYILLIVVKHKLI